MSRTLCWFSCGAASAVATKLTLAQVPDAIPVYCATGSEHPDNTRFLADCEKWFGKSVTTIRSEKFKDTWDVWERERYLSGINGAPCTRALKFRPRLAFQRPDDIHAFGYTDDKLDRARAERLRENFPELTIQTPLIDAGLSKEAVLEMVLRAGIKLPPMYAMGFHNNNCIPCSKSQSPAYWALIRECFPNDFARMVELSRRLDVRLVKIKGERRFIDEIPLSQPTNNPIQPSCDFLCALAEQGLEDQS
ncbi:phosphoadenosine phosphosulfate reductase family protein [uncultured Cohaesibacter sp.]|uniref:phosphoadenosine phosphosulfate reductase domain-containing protein n=1 Tax=uncultured Cohaesibacter sp. TaxID=1002546 RepID=UPI0029C9631E|nr:phosphoadenosine phosphosulfate reductase family protein [uncultured Cohaesibacter sp.]